MQFAVEARTTTQRRPFLLIVRTGHFVTPSLVLWPLGRAMRDPGDKKTLEYCRIQPEFPAFSRVCSSRLPD